MSSSLATPKYRTLSEVLKSMIQTGHYRLGQQIPTEQELVTQYGVSRNTVRQAILLLEEDNYLIRRRGAGTFVNDPDSTQKPSKPLESIVVLVVNNGRTSNYHLQQIATAEQWASERDISLTVANLSTDELLKGRRPAAVKTGYCQAIFFDGWVDDMHCLVAEELNMPYLVVGNRPISPKRPQVRLDVQALIQHMIVHLQSLTATQPIALMIEPLSLHLCQEILVAYTQQVHQLPQRLPMIELIDVNQSHLGIERLLDTYSEPFSLITRGGYLPAIAETYHRRGIDPARCPAIALTHSFEVEGFSRLPFHLMPYGGDTIMATAMTEFLAAYESGQTASLNISLCPTQIISPKED